MGLNCSTHKRRASGASIEIASNLCYNKRQPRCTKVTSQAESRKPVPPSRHHPHDKLFRTVLADKEEAEGLLRAYLLETISQQQQIGDKIVMTLAEEWFQEGEAKGKIESQFATIEKLLQMKMDWTFIKQVTEIDQQGDGELKRQLAQLRERNGSVSRQPASN